MSPEDNKEGQHEVTEMGARWVPTVFVTKAEVEIPPSPPAPPTANASDGTPSGGNEE